MTAPATPLRKTPLNATHRRHGAKMVDFGGWDMPVQYSGLIDEHRTVRTAVGLFDVSHMGEIEVRGPEALKLVNYVATNDAALKLKIGQAQYSGLLYEHGGFVDDILVHKVADDHYFLCVNASNQDKDYEHIAAHNKFDCTVENAGERYAQIAVQGPRALDTLQKLTERRTCADQVLSLQGRRQFRARQRESRARDTPGRTDSRFTSHRTKRRGSGMI